MIETYEWITASPSRGYDHPIDRMQLTDELVPAVKTPVSAPLFSDEQRNRTLEQLALPSVHDEEVLRAVARVALGCQADRDGWELANLRAMGLVPNTASKEMDEYARFAGQPERVSSFINWFGRLTDTLPARPIDNIIIDYEGRLQTGEVMDDASITKVKGYTLTVGTASQNGLYNLSSPLDAAVHEGLNRLRSPQYDYRVKQYTRHGAPSRHEAHLIRDERGEVWQSDQGAFMLHIVRERGLADIEERHVIKRFDSVVALSSLALIRDLMSVLADSGEIKTKSGRQQLDDFMHAYEETIHRQGRSRGVHGITVSPVSTTYLIRDPKK